MEDRMILTVVLSYDGCLAHNESAQLCTTRLSATLTLSLKFNSSSSLSLISSKVWCSSQEFCEYLRDLFSWLPLLWILWGWASCFINPNFLFFSHPCQLSHGTHFIFFDLRDKSTEKSLCIAEFIEGVGQREAVYLKMSTYIWFYHNSIKSSGFPTHESPIGNLSP